MKIFFTLFCTPILALLLASCSPPQSVVPRIAHAGGELNGLTYTNSLEALDANYAADFRAFEIDLSWTADDQLVCLHDWEVAFEDSFGRSIASPLSLDEFKELAASHPNYTKCTLDSLMHWLAQHPDAKLITDLKEANLQALELIAKRFPQQLRQLIPQIYQPSEYTTAQALGYENLIWTLYQFSGSTSDILKHLEQMEVWAVTMDQVRAIRKLGQALDKHGIHSYVHTINGYADYLYFTSLGIDEIYTDSLSHRQQRLSRLNPWLNIKDSKLYQQKMQREASMDLQKQEFQDLRQLIYSVSETDLSLINFYSQIDNVDILPKGFSFQATGRDPFFLLPPLSRPVTELQLYLRLSVPDPSSAQLFFSTIEDHTFVAERVVRQTTEHQGENELLFSLDSAVPIRQLRIDVGSFPGAYTISELVVRTDELAP